MTMTMTMTTSANGTNRGTLVLPVKCWRRRGAHTTRRLLLLLPLRLLVRLVLLLVLRLAIRPATRLDPELRSSTWAGDPLPM